MVSGGQSPMPPSRGPGTSARRLAGNYDTDTAEVYAIHLNVTEKYPVPVFGNQMDAKDFSPLPSTDCPRLRDPDV